MTPGFMTSTYQLFRLYLETRNTVKADSMAHLVVRKQVKKENARIQTMRTEATEYLQKH